MADGVFNIAKGAVAEMVRDSDSDLLVLLLETAQADATLVRQRTESERWHEVLDIARV